MILILMIGIILRCTFPGDIEYKYDERLLYQETHLNSKPIQFPSLGMYSAVGLIEPQNPYVSIHNPATSQWILILLAELIPVHTPIILTSLIILLNCLALLLFAHWIMFSLPKAEQGAWKWGLMLASVNPLAVLFSRKLWAQDMLPLFVTFFWMSWAFRKKPLGAFQWGFWGALLGQIHMSGFFFSLALLLSTITSDYRANRLRLTSWKFWMAGSFLGLLLLLPWLTYIFPLFYQKIWINQGSIYPFAIELNWNHLWNFNFWRNWLLEGLGLGLDYSLGLNLPDFFKYPRIGTVPLYLGALFSSLSFVIGIAIYGRAALLWLNTPNHKKFKFFQATDLTSTALLGGFLVLGLIFTILRFHVYMHYLIVCFPLPWVFIARLALKQKGGENFLQLSLAAQLVTTLLFLGFIHSNNGAPKGDYWYTYNYQIQNKID